MRRALAPGAVATACGDGAAVDDDGGVDGLQRVVGACEEAEVGGSGGVGAVGAELRKPEAVQVRLVAHDDLARADLAGERRRELGEPGDVRVRGGRLRASRRVHAEDHVHPEQPGGTVGVPQHRLVLRGRRLLVERPGLAHVHRVEAGLADELQPRLGGGDRRLPHRVLDHPDRKRGPAGRRLPDHDQRRDDGCEEGQRGVRR